MTQSEKCDVIITGAGIAGLTTALCLARAGLNVTIFERSKELEEAGAGIQLTPNAARILIGLGLENELKTVSSTPEYLEIGYISKNTPLAEMDLEDTSQIYGAPWFSLRRANLQSILLKAVALEPDISLKLGQTIELFTQSETGVVIKCRSPSDVLSEYQGSILVGADGLWSGVRSIISGSFQPSFTGYEAWRALLPIEDVPSDYLENKIKLRLGTNCHLVTYQVSKGKALNIVFIQKANNSRDLAGGKSWSHVGCTFDLEQCLKQADPAVCTLFEKVKKWQVWSLYDMPVSKMALGNVVIIGDAAHPILPFLAQGAAMAIEDAAVLAECLKNQAEDYPSALQKFSRLRQKRNKTVSRNARRNGHIYHLGWPLNLFRNLFITMLGSQGMANKYKWLYGWKQ